MAVTANCEIYILSRRDYDDLRVLYVLHIDIGISRTTPKAYKRYNNVVIITLYNMTYNDLNLGFVNIIIITKSDNQK